MRLWPKRTPKDEWQNKPESNWTRRDFRRHHDALLRQYLQIKAGKIQQDAANNVHERR